MTTQAIALIYVEDMEIMKQYKEVAGQALAKHGGRVVAAGAPQAVLEATLEKPNVLALLEFPDLEKAQSWRDDPDLVDIHALRNKAGRSTIMVIPG